MTGITMNVQVHVEQDLLQTLPIEVRETIASELLIKTPPETTKFTSAELWKIQRRRKKATPSRRKIDPVS